MSCHSVRSCFAPEASFHAVVVASEKRASDVPCGVVRISGSFPRFPIRITLLTLAMCSPSFQVLTPYSTFRRTDDVRASRPARIRQRMAGHDNEEARGRLVRSASTITPLTLLSRLTGYLRDKVIAILLGAGMRSDAFFVAFRIPNMLREIIGEGAMSSAVIPVYAEVSSRRSDEQARAFVGRIAGTFALILTGITALGIVA